MTALEASAIERFLLFTFPEGKGYATSCRATGVSTSISQEAREKHRPQPLLGFHGKGMAGQSKQFRIGYLE